MTVITLTKSIPIDAPAAVVFAAMTDWDNQSQWMLGTSVGVGNKQGRGIGGTIIARTSFGPFGFNDPMTITDWNVPTLCAVTHTGRVVRGTGRFEVKSIDERSSQFIWSEKTNVPFGLLGRIVWTVVKYPIGLGLSWSLRRFKRWVESAN